MSTYFDWRLGQWAEAVAWFARVKGFTPLPDHRGACEVYHAWRLRHDTPPGSEASVLVTEYRWHEVGKPCIEKNIPWAARLFVHGMRASIYQPKEEA